MIREDGPDTHGASMESCFPTQTTQGGMAMYNVDLFSYYDVPEYGKEREDGGHSGRAVYGPERHIVAFQTIREISNSCPIIIGVSDNDDLVTSIDEPLGQLIYMALDASRLREEEVADHSDVIRCFRHLGCFCIAGSSLGTSFEGVVCHSMNFMTFGMQTAADEA